MVYFTKLYRQYSFDRRIVLGTDYAALQWLQRTPKPIGQQGRWLERLPKFDFKIVHRSGRRHGNADALYRRPFREYGLDDLNPVTGVAKEIVETPLNLNNCSQDSIAVAQSEDPDLKVIRPWLKEGAQVYIVYGRTNRLIYWPEG